MADVQALDSLIADLAAEALRSTEANDELQACLIAGLGTAIASRARGNADLANALCERASVQILEAAALFASLLDDAGRL
jgi:hypothetical protein